MSISAKGQSALQKVTSSRLSIENLDEVSRVLSSNICEKCFEILAKYVEGKRTNMGKMNNWIVLQTFAAGLRSNGDCSRNLRLELGTYENKLMSEMKEKSTKRKEYLKQH